jgi:hypothetical protein
MKMPRDKTLDRLSAAYGCLLRLYPAQHRAEYGAPMAQLFRDQCREMLRQGSVAARLRFCRDALLDLVTTVFRENLSNIENIMNTNRPARLSLILFIVALVVHLTSCSIGAAGSLGTSAALIYLGAVALLARAGAEWFRPANQRLQAFVWVVVLLVLYGLFFPMWAKIRMQYGAAFHVEPPLMIAALLANVFVPVAKLIIGLRRQTT